MAVNFALTLLLLVALILLFWLYVRAEKAIDQANIDRLDALTLAEELRHSSDALTRMARNYVVTGNPVYKGYYQEILDIRDGRKPRPEQFDSIYWDLANASQAPPPATGPRLPLLELIARTGIEEAEYRLLDEAKVNSDDLTAREFAAMALLETPGPDPEQERRNAALKLLFDDQYHQAKAGIMRPIQEFMNLLDHRTLERVRAAQDQAGYLRTLFIACGLCLLFMVWRSWASLREILGASPVEVHTHIARLGHGDFTTDFAVPPGRENSVIGWLAETGLKLREYERTQQAATERYRQAMERLRISEERFRLLATHALDNLWTMGLDHRLRYISPSIETLVGYTVKEYMGLTLEQQLMPESLVVANAYFAGLHERLASGASVADYPFRGEIALRARDGSPVWTEIIATPLVDGEGRMLEVAGVTRDIRERKRYETELHQAREAAEAANRSKSDFLAHMSHEIRNPMNAILGLAQMLAAEPLETRQQTLVARIREAGQSLLTLLNDLLDLSKIEAGQLRIEPCPFDLDALMVKAADLLSPMARAKGIELRLEATATPLGPLLGDPLRLEQVIINLASNAIKFTEQGQVVIQYGPCQDRAPGQRLCIEVWDSGIGIAPEALAKLFTPFTQAEPGITRRFGGTGLGLAISKRLVELMGGEIGAESQVGLGSTFWVELPLVPASGDLGEQRTQAPTPLPTGPRLPGLRILIVDDTDINRELVDWSLTRQGARVTQAVHGQEALALLRAQSNAFDAVLMDIVVLFRFSAFIYQ